MLRNTLDLSSARAAVSVRGGAGPVHRPSSTISACSSVRLACACGGGFERYLRVGVSVLY